MTSAYSVFDRKEEKYNTPFFVANDDSARRLFAIWCKDGLMKNFPEDFVLYKIGAFDEKEGEIYEAGTYDVPVKTIVAVGTDYVQKEN